MSEAQPDAVPWPWEKGEPGYKTATWERRYTWENDVPRDAVFKAAGDFIAKKYAKHGARFEVHGVHGDDSYLTVFYRIFPAKEL